MSSTGMPILAFSDWTKASKEELVEELLNLRLFVASLYHELQTFTRNGELPDAAHQRIATLEVALGDIPELVQHVHDLENDVQRCTRLIYTNLKLS